MDVDVDGSSAARVDETLNSSDGVLGVGITKPPRNTSKHPLPESCVLKRSQLGRAQLFLTGINYTDVRCSASITQHVQRNSLFHPHRQNGRLPEVFNRPCDMACWHCVHRFTTPPVPVPKDYDAAEGVYHVFGSFCSLACAKAYLLETPTFNTGLMVMLLSKMGREIYGEEKIDPAPPRLSLDIFGGPFSIDTFRAKKNKVLVHVPPFVSTYMVCEERSEAHDALALGVDNGASVRGLRRPAASEGEAEVSSAPAQNDRSVYSRYVEGRTTGSDPPPPPPPPAQHARRERPASAQRTTLSQFMKK